MKAFLLILTLASMNAFAQQVGNGDPKTDFIIAHTQCIGTSSERIKLEFEKSYSEKDPHPEASLTSFGRTTYGDVIVVSKNLEAKSYKFSLYLCKDGITPHLKDLEGLQVLKNASSDFIGNVYLGGDGFSHVIKFSFYPTGTNLGVTETADQKIKDEEQVKLKVNQGENQRSCNEEVKKN